MSEGPTASEVAKARKFAPPVLTLGRRAVSPEAEALVAHCLQEIVLPSLPPGKKRPTTVPAIQRALEGALGGLIEAGGQWLRRSMDRNSFRAEPGITVDQFSKVKDALVAAGFVQHAPGFIDRSGMAVGGVQTRLRLSQEGLELAASFGVTGPPESHFCEPSGPQPD